MSKKIATFALVTVIGFAASLHADSKSSQLSVSVEVVARTLLTIDAQPATIDVTAEDVARGYVDLPQAVQFHIRSNAADGYRVRFEPMSFPFRSAAITWENALATISSGEGSWITRSYERGTTAGAFNVRLNLAPGSEPGTYPWPVHFSV
jgi:hypothetical protein